MVDLFDKLKFGLRPKPRFLDSNRLNNTIGISRPTYGPFSIPEDTSSTSSRSPRSFIYEDIVDLTSMGIQYLQGYHKQFGGTEKNDPWQIWFPFQAWELSVGQKIKNVTTNGFYKIKDKNNKYFGVYKLESSGQAPGKCDILLPEESGLVQFRIGYPNNEDNNAYFSNEEMREKQKDPWTDTITYRYLKVEPAGGTSYFSGGTKDLRSRQMPAVTLADGTTALPTVQRFDVRLQFDCWAKTNENAVSLARWFRECMGWLIPIMQGNGLDHGHFIRQREDIHLVRWRNDIVARSLVYEFRVQENRLIIPDILRSIGLNFAVSDGGEIATSTTMEMTSDQI